MLALALAHAHALAFGIGLALGLGLGLVLALTGHMRYLGVELDNNWKIHEHFRLLSPWLRGTATALSRLLPNLEDPNDKPRRLYAGVMESMALHGTAE